jgi:transcriptional regulator with XRE-family HTH domain
LAEKTHLDKSTIHRIENTKKYPTHVPELATLEAIAQAFGLDLSDVLGQLEKKSGSVTQPDHLISDKRASTSKQIEGAYEPVGLTVPDVNIAIDQRLREALATIDARERSAIARVQRATAAARTKQSNPRRRRS